MAAGTKRSSAIGGARCVAASTPGGTRTEFWLFKPGGDPRAHAPQGACEHLVCALNLLANLQAGGDNLVDSIFECLQERSRLS